MSSLSITFPSILSQEKVRFFNEEISNNMVKFNDPIITKFLNEHQSVKGLLQNLNLSDEKYLDICNINDTDTKYTIMGTNVTVKVITNYIINIISKLDIHGNIISDSLNNKPTFDEDWQQFNNSFYYTNGNQYTEVSYGRYINFDKTVDFFKKVISKIQT